MDRTNPEQTCSKVPQSMVRFSGVACGVALDLVVIYGPPADAQKYPPFLDGDVSLESVKGLDVGFKVDMVVISPTLEWQVGVSGGRSVVPQPGEFIDQMSHDLRERQPRAGVGPNAWLVVHC
jgi:hypothetical protein